MRFEGRLRTHFEIEDAALQAQLPAMLLQPLVENAIKYAVSPLEATSDRFQIGDLTITDVAQSRSRLAVAEGACNPRRRT
ncbi:hypothetical protein [Mycobacterium tuberculosis]|uniref:hypothetical protein n=1 Tax=Mycobacterium tuberculosis TaxID=1773 RepID=UPI0035105FE4